MSRLPDESKKKKILETAFCLFGTLGFKNTTIKMVADKSHIAPGSVYTYFHSKKKLYRQTSGHIWKMLEEEVKTIVHSPVSFDDKVSRLGKRGSQILKRSSFLLLSIYEKPGRRKWLFDHLEDLCWQLLPIFKTEEAPKELKETSAENTVYFLRNYISGILFQYLLMTTPEEQETFLAYTWKKVEVELARNKASNNLVRDKTK